MHYGLISYFFVRYLLEDELLTCDFYDITDGEKWLPYDQSDLTSHLPPVKFSDDEVTIPSDDTFNEYLMGLDWYDKIANSINIKEIEYDNKICFISNFNTNKKYKLTPIELSKIWTLYATTHDCIRTSGTLGSRFRT